MWKRACDTAAKCIAEAKEHNKQRWDKSHMELDFKEVAQVLVSTLSFNNLKGPKKMRNLFLGPFTIIRLIGKNATEEDECPPRKKNPTPPEIVEVEESLVPVKKIINARKIRLNDKH
ncbi:hypothetical protein O181_093484 [Austropuccinia psidii MF-1]|uniref:Uncharacterized protein n=1 Tax=Austropuccinia psidii MF-1 TaxID=1389203 RepID=A0A9Q3J1A6_9BASI|nr:hypothetical protein [Austropuccinia psidii MF-1]